MSWIDGRVLVHVGLPKTATSWLQENYFPIESSGYWIPSVRSSIRHPIKQIGHWLIADDRRQLVDEADFDAAPIRDELAVLVPFRGLVPVVSNERLAGHPLSGGFDRTAIARRVKQVFPRARILITIREQNRIIMSSYMQYLKYGGWHTPELFLQPPSDGRVPVLSLNFWDYDRLAAVYEGIFGAENVLVLPQELLRRNADVFLKKIAEFAGVNPPSSVNIQAESNPRKPHVSSYFLRRMTSLRRKSSANAFMPCLFSPRVEAVIEQAAKSFVNIATPNALEKRFAASLQERVNLVIGDHFAMSNRRFAKRAVVDLASLGYRV